MQKSSFEMPQLQRMQQIDELLWNFVISKMKKTVVDDNTISSHNTANDNTITNLERGEVITKKIYKSP